MGLRDMLFGKASGQAPPTTRPDVPTRLEVTAQQGRRTGRALRDLSAVLRGQSRSAQVICSYGHPVPPGSTTCAYGHWVG